MIKLWFKSLVLEPSLVRMSVQASAFTGHVSHHKLFCGSMKGLVNSLPAQSLKFLQVAPHKGHCVRFYPKGCAAETYHRRRVGSSPFGITLKQQTLLQPTPNSPPAVSSAMDLSVTKMGTLGFFVSLSQVSSIIQ